MSDITRNKKEYSIGEANKILLLKNNPPGYQYEIEGHIFNFETFKLSDEKDEDVGWAIARYIWWKRSERSIKTLKTNYISISRVLEFIELQRPEVISINQIDESFLDSYLYWLKYIAKKKYTDELLAMGTQKVCWSAFRAFIRRLQIEGVVTKTIRIPQNSFPGLVDNSYKPLSESEVERLLSACKYEITRIRKDKNVKSRVSIADLLPYAIVVSLRTGINPEVLFNMEVTSKSITQGYLNKTERLVLPVKKRSGKSQNITIKESASEDHLRVKSRVSNLLREVDDLTSDLREKLPKGSQFANYLWLVKGVQTKKIIKFSDAIYSYEVRRFVRRYQLLDDFGESLVLSFRRLRPTFAEGYLKSNGGDIRDLQKRLNHSSITTTMRYLDPNLEDRVSSFSFAGRSMVEWAVDNKGMMEGVSKQFEISLECAENLVTGNHDTPVSKCIDPMNSPLKGVKSGVLCTEFLGCFRCGNMVVLREDARKLFSFYYWLEAKKEIIGAENWDQAYGWIIKIIDRDIAPQLGDIEWVLNEKEKAKCEPFPLWKTPSVSNREEL